MFDWHFFFMITFQCAEEVVMYRHIHEKIHHAYIASWGVELFLIFVLHVSNSFGVNLIYVVLRYSNCVSIFLWKMESLWYTYFSKGPHRKDRIWTTNIEDKFLLRIPRNNLKDEVLYKKKDCKLYIFILCYLHTCFNVKEGFRSSLQSPLSSQ